jgi:hypothetical protein
MMSDFYTRTWGVPTQTLVEMSLAPLPMLQFAKHLIAYEIEGDPSAAQPDTIAFPVIAKLSPHFITLMGSYGFQVLLARALALAGEEVTWLRKVHMNNEGALNNTNDPMTAEIFLEGKVVLVAHLVELLIAFIGESLTLRLLHDVWPKVSSKDFNTNEGANNEIHH